jgi:hypothetical protein
LLAVFLFAYYYTRLALCVRVCVHEFVYKHAAASTFLFFTRSHNYHIANLVVLLQKKIKLIFKSVTLLLFLKCSNKFKSILTIGIICRPITVLAHGIEIWKRIPEFHEKKFPEWFRNWLVFVCILNKN